MTYLLEVDNIEFSYSSEHQTTPVLRGCSFQVAAGEMVAIQGPSGSGKSTLLYLLGCMNHAQTGKIRIAGSDITRLSSDAAAIFRNRHIGFVFQQFHLLPKATALQNITLPSVYPIEFAAAPAHQVQRRGRELATLLGLGDRVDYLPQQLSGGQQQRVAIARALMNDPSLILADEPTGNLDSQNAKAVLQEFRKLQKMGKTIVIITHDREVAEQADRIIYLQDGRVVREETRQAARDGGSAALPKETRISSGFTPSYRRILPLAWSNVFRNRARSLLTMLGISIGIAAVLSMLTLGRFAKERILSSYSELGVNTLAFYGYENWQQRRCIQPLFHLLDFRGSEICCR